MCTDQSDSIVNKVLKSLCCNSGWSYGVFWRFDQRNSLLLTMQDAYYDEQMGVLIDDMFLQVHMLGGGIIGQAAFTKKHRWMFSDAHSEGQNFGGSISSPDLSQDNSDFHHQFATGIKTIAIIPVEPQGVLQFGSTQKIPEGTEFVNQTKRVFQGIGNCDGLNLSEISPSFSNYEYYGSSGLFASLLSSGNTNFSDLKFPHSASCQDLMETTCSSETLIQPFFCTSDHARSSHFNIHTQSTWSSGDSSLTSVNHQASQNESPTLHSSASLINKQHSTLSLQEIESRLLEGPDSPSMLEDLVKASNYNTDHLKSCSMDSFFHWFAPLLDQSNDMDVTTLNNFNGGDSTRIIPDNHPANSVQSSITNTSHSNAKEKCSNMFNAENDLYASFGVDFGHGQMRILDDLLMPVINSGQLDFRADTSECVSNQNVGSTIDHQKGLFSKLGIEQLIEGNSGISSSDTRPTFEDQVSSTDVRKKSGIFLGRSAQVLIADPPSFSGKSPFQQQNKDTLRFDMGSRISNGYETNARPTDLKHKKLGVTAKKGMKKKAKPGTRPRPKDRQQILDRLAELRVLVPNGEKMSIDCLLARTIKYMLFLQSVTKHAHMLKQADKTKDYEMVQKENSNSRGSGVTWACEVGDQTMVCPLLVEDLNAPGQMLIQMLCEEQGFFLEIVDTVRGFGLTILKGVMEVRENKIWARFTVDSEANRHVTRHEIFSTLVQLLQLTDTSGVNTSEQLGNVIDGGTNLVNNYQQSVVPFPVSLAEALHHASL